MSQSEQTNKQNRIVDLKVSGHLMTLDAGLYCIFNAPGQPASEQNGLPGIRLSSAPGAPKDAVVITGFDEDGWLGASHGAALVRVMAPGSQVLVTFYQSTESQRETPKLQVLRLNDAAAASAAHAATPIQPLQAAAPAAPAKATPAKAAAPVATPAPIENPEIAAHIERRGDVIARIGDWMGEPGSQAWIEGFGIAPTSLITAEDIEYQAVLGKGWLSPWAQGGQYCGSKGMALPILGLRVRLKGEAADKFKVSVEASFTDGSTAGPVDDTMTAEAESLAPLEAFRLVITPRAASAAAAPAAKGAKAKKPAVAPVVVAAPAKAAKQVAAPAPKRTVAKPAPVVVAPTRGRPSAATRAKATIGDARRKRAG